MPSEATISIRVKDAGGSPSGSPQRPPTRPEGLSGGPPRQVITHHFHHLGR